MLLIRISDNERELNALRRVLAYLREEERDYEEQGRPTEHIWEAVQMLSIYLTEVEEHLQTLDHHLQTIAKRLRREGRWYARLPHRATVKQRDGRVGLVWIAEKKKGCHHCKQVEELIPCEDCQRDFCGYCLRCWMPEEGPPPHRFLCPECWKKPLYA